METCYMHFLILRNMTLVLDNSFKQTPHHLNQPYLMWAAVLCQRSSRTWNLFGHAFPPRGSGLQMLHDKAGLGLSICWKAVAIEDDVQPAN